MILCGLIKDNLKPYGEGWREMNVLSLFDGMRCGYIALERADIKVDTYFASEVDKYAMEVADNNYPKAIQLGDVINIDVNKLPNIDLLLGGSPCQGFSFAGKQLAFNDARSKLFFEYVRILKEIQKNNPDVKFLLENVRMKKEYLDIISGFLGVEPIKINSSLVSAQNRIRYYWTNIKIVGQPEDRKIGISDILEHKCEYIKCDKKGVKKNNQEKSGCLTGGASPGGNHSDMDLIYVSAKQLKRGFNCGYEKYIFKSPTLSANSWQYNNFIKSEEGVYRRYTPIECERLQTLPDNYTEVVSNTQRYKMIGNGWTVDVIAHILKGLSLDNSLE